MKMCFKCGEKKPLSEFYRHPRMADGHLGKCKACARTYASHAHRIKSGDAEWVERQRERGREKYRRLYGPGPNWTSPAATAEEKQVARATLTKAIKSGAVKRPDRCGDCGEGGVRIHGHHDDYSKPLDVAWVCPMCHRKRHASFPERVLGRMRHQAQESA